MLRGLPSLRALPAWVGQLPLENLTLAACGPVTRLGPLTLLTALRSLVLQARPPPPLPAPALPRQRRVERGPPVHAGQQPFSSASCNIRYTSFTMFLELFPPAKTCMYIDYITTFMQLRMLLHISQGNTYICTQMSVP